MNENGRERIQNPAEEPALFSLTCPLPFSNHGNILLGHGGGGRLGSELLNEVFLPAFQNDTLSRLEDQATLSLGGAKLAFTTDSFVVQPIFFPGGDIGSLAIHGTVNDLAVGGAKPLFLSAAFIIEEGLPILDLQKIVNSMKKACAQSNVSLVAGDTKVVDRGKGDKIFITTSGIGLIPDNRNLSIAHARPGDQVIVSGTIGDHGIAIMSARQGIEFESILESDTAPLWDLTQTMLEFCPSLRCMRDPTRGGLASTLNEIAAGSKVGIKIQEQLIPVRPEVNGACEMLGLDPLYVANEGKLVAIVPASESEELLSVMRKHPLGLNAAIIGKIVAEHPGLITTRTAIGGERLVPLLAGEQLPRIC